MKKRALAILMAALTASTMFAVPTFAADYSGEDPQLEKNIKILTIWAEDNDNGMLLNKICEDYQKNVNPNFTWEYEMVASDNLQQKIATLAASNDLPDLFAYEAGAPLSVLIDSGKVKNITEAVDEIGTADYLNSGAVELLKGLSGTDDLYDLPLGLNVEGFWYNKACSSRQDAKFLLHGMSLKRFFRNFPMQVSSLLQPADLTNGVQPV